MRKKRVFKNACMALWYRLQKNPYYTREDYKAVVNLIKPLYFNDKVPCNLFTYGNKKLPKNVMIFNLPTIATCKHACGQCYALPPERMFPKIRVFRAKNLLLMLLAERDKNYYKILQNFFNSKVQEHAMTYREPIFRWHEAGDFYNKNYYNYAVELAKNNHAVIFYGYTKMIHDNLLQLNNDNIDNFNIINSVVEIDGEKMDNFGNTEHVEKMKKNNIKICPDTGHGNICMQCCKCCLKCSRVGFKVHGAGVKHV